MTTSWKNTSCRSPSPTRLGIGRTEMPGSFMSTRKMQMPSLRRPLVLASRKQWSARAAYDVQTFEPLITKRIAVPFGDGAQRKKIGSRGWLGEALAPDHAPLGHLAKIPVFLVRRAVAHQRRTDPVDVHVLRSARLAGRPHLLAQDEVFPGRPALSAIFRRPMRDEQAGLRQARTERQRELGLPARARPMERHLLPVPREFRAQEVLQALAERHVFAGPSEVHRRD